MNSFSTIVPLGLLALALFSPLRAAGAALDFVPPFRSGMVLADWRSSASTNVILRGKQTAEQNVFVRFNAGKAIAAESLGTEWWLTVEHFTKSKQTLPRDPLTLFTIEVTARYGMFSSRPAETNRLTNVLLGSVWVVAVPAAADWSQAREKKFTNGLVRFHLGDPTATNGPGWFLSGQPSAPLKPPNIAAHFAEEFFQRGRGEPVGIYLVQQKPPEIDEDIRKDWTQVRQTTGAAAARAAGKIAVQASRAERAAFVARSRAAKMQGAVIEGEPPVEEGTDFSLRQCGRPPDAWPLFHQLQVHGFLW